MLENQGERRPDLFIIGAAKCGTTSLHAYLAQHPDVFMSDPKEPGYFVPEMDYYPKDLSWYLGLFAGAGKARVVGESSTHYTKVPVYSCVADRVADFSPDARIIYLMRDPIERAISHYWFNARIEEEARPLLTAIREDVQYRAFGEYAMQLRPWMDRFGSDRILTLVFEEMVEDPGGVLAEVLEWLGLAELPDSLRLEKKNARPGTIRMPRGTGRINRLRYSGAWDKVSPLVPRGIKEWAKGLALETVRPEDESVDDAIAYLKPWARESVAELRELLGRDFPRWETTLEDGE